METRYFKLLDRLQVKLPDNVMVTIKKNTIFHVQSQYRSTVTGDDMVVIAIDKCTPIAVNKSIGIILD